MTIQNVDRCITHTSAYGIGRLLQGISGVDIELVQAIVIRVSDEEAKNRAEAILQKYFPSLMSEGLIIVKFK